MDSRETRKSRAGGSECPRENDGKVEKWLIFPYDSEVKLSVITVNFNHKHFPKLSVDALERSTTNFDFEIIFVDN